MRGGGGQKMSVFVQAQGVKTNHAGVKKWQNSVHVVVECPIMLPTQVQLGIRVLILKQARGT